VRSMGWEVREVPWDVRSSCGVWRWGRIEGGWGPRGCQKGWGPTGCKGEWGPMGCEGGWGPMGCEKGGFSRDAKGMESHGV